ncbi:MAG: hypothetical protein ABSC94_32575 [Polyangiaceae bacterium]
MLRALAKDPDHRQRSVEEFYKELAELEVVDDGSAKYKTDAPTVPSVGTMSRGRMATLSDSAGNADAQGQAPDEVGGGWIEMARARLRDGRGPHATLREAIDPRIERATHTLGEASDAGAEAVLDARGETPASGQATPVETPMTGASAHRAERRRRVGPAMLRFGAAVLALAGTWAGWKAAHSGAAKMSVALVVPSSKTTKIAAPPLVDRGPAPEAPIAAPPVDRGPAPEGRLAGPPGVSTAAEGFAAGPRGGGVIAPAVPSAHENVGTRRAPVRAPPKPKDPPDDDLDDVLFAGTVEPPKQTSPAPSAGQGGPSAATPSGQPIPPIPNLDDVFFGPEPAPPSSTSTPRGAIPVPSKGARSPSAVPRPQ